MAYDVFVSYAFENKPVADTIVHRLEAAGIRCWYAPRDPSPGANYAVEIVNALNQSRVMVLVLSAYANESRHVRNEVERAVQAGLTIIPMRIEDVLPSPDIGLHISSVHWLNALTLPLEQHVDELLGVVLRNCDIDLKSRPKPVPPLHRPMDTARDDARGPENASRARASAQEPVARAVPDTRRTTETTSPGVPPPLDVSLIGVRLEDELPGPGDIDLEGFDGGEPVNTRRDKKPKKAKAATAAPKRTAAPASTGSRVLIAVAVGVCVLLVAGAAGVMWPRGVSAGTPEAALDSFCAAWVRGDYATMYGLLSKPTRQKVESAKWQGQMAREANVLGLPAVYRLDGPVQDNGDLSLWNVWLTHEKSSVGELRKQLWLVREAEGYRLREGPERFPPKALGSKW